MDALKVMLAAFAVWVVACAAPPPTSLVVGAAAPEFSLTHSDGSGVEVGLSEHRGRWVLLDFWSTWCPPCQHAMATELAPLWERFGDDAERFALISVGTPWNGDSAEAQARFAAAHGYGWTFVFDGDGEVSRRYDVTGIPTLVLVDPEGRVAAVGHAEIARRVAVILADGGSSS